MKAFRVSAIPFALLLTSCWGGDRSEGHFERTLKVSDKVTLYVDTGAGSINVHTGTGDSVNISARIRARGSFTGMNARTKVERIESNPPIRQEGNTIRIGRLDDSEVTKNVFIDYELTVPARTQLTTNTGAGNQTIVGLQLPIEATTGAGRILVEDVTGDAHLHTGAGNVEVRSAQGRLVADSGAGSIKASGDPKSDWDLRVGAGSIKVEVPAASSFELDANSGFGHVRVDQELGLDGSISSSHVRGKVGHGGPVMRLNNGAGTIDVSGGRAQN